MSYYKRDDLVQCPRCEGRKKIFWNFGHSSCKCYLCEGKGEITMEDKKRMQFQKEGHSPKVVEVMLDEYFE